MYRFILGLLICLLSWPVLGQAERLHSSKVLTLEDAVQEVLSSNPEVRASHYRVEAAKARTTQARSLDNPEVGVEFMNVPISTGDVRRGGQINYMINQAIPFPSKLYERGKAASYDALATKNLSNSQIQDVILDVTRTYYDLYRLDRTIEVNRESQRLLRELRGSTETWYATGKTSVVIPLKAQLELTTLRNNELRLRQERLTHEAHMKALLGRASHESIVIPRKVQIRKLRGDIHKIQETAQLSRPEIKTLDAMEKRDQAKLSEARQGLLPDFTLGFEYNQRPNMEDAWTGRAAITVPLFFWGKNRGEMREAKANLKATQAEHEAIRNHTNHVVEESYQKVGSSEKILRSYERELLPQSRTTLNAAQTAYASNQTDFMTLIDAERSYREIQMSYYETQAQLGMAQAELDRLVGTNQTYKGESHD